MTTPEAQGYHLPIVYCILYILILSILFLLILFFPFSPYKKSLTTYFNEIFDKTTNMYRTPPWRFQRYITSKYLSDFNHFLSQPLIKKIQITFFYLIHVSYAQYISIDCISKF